MLIATSAARSQEPEPLPDIEPTFRVLFFNTHLLPAIAQTVAGHRGQDDYRTQAIGTQIANFDIVGLCEVFEARRRDEIVKRAQEASASALHVASSPKPTGRHVVSGGLLLLTRYAIIGEPDVLTYASGSRVITTGLKADGLAAKGAIHAVLRVQDNPPLDVDCFLTHLESVSPTARAEQIAELAKFISEHAGADRPLLLMGDLNVEADFPINAPGVDTEYRRLTTALQFGDRRLIDVWPRLHTTRGGTNDALAKEECRRIDYIFLSPFGSGSLAWAARNLRVEPFLDAQVKQGSLSDHAGVACELSLREPDPQ
jgi:endonuclease/exonuclease/phosphatase family metal-dependent hydrolase